MLMIIFAVAGAVLAVLVTLFALITVTLRAEDRCAKSILGPAPGPLTAITRRITGLYVRAPAVPCGPTCHCHPQPARAASGADSRGGENSWPSPYPWS
jgi:hypothetical protein